MITLKDLSTREILNAFRDNHVSPEFEEQIFVASRMTTGGIPQGVSATKAELHTELASRPHVSNKQEAKLIRRLRAETGWTEEELRAHPKFGTQIVDVQYPNRREVSPEYAASISRYYPGDSFGKRFKVVTR